MIAAATLMSIGSLSCVVSTVEGIAGTVQEEAVPVKSMISEDDFQASGHSDLEGMSDRRVQESEGRMLLLANYEDNPHADIQIEVHAYDGERRAIEWHVFEAVGVDGQLMEQSRAEGYCQQEEHSSGGAV